MLCASLKTPRPASFFSAARPRDSLARPAYCVRRRESRLHGNEHLNEGETVRENNWIYLSKRDLDSLSIGAIGGLQSRSRPTTLAGSRRIGATASISSASSTTSSDYGRNCGSNKLGGSTRSVSYRGSECSVLLAPSTATVTVNEERRLQPLTATWCANGRHTAAAARSLQSTSNARSHHQTATTTMRQGDALPLPARVASHRAPPTINVGAHFAPPPLLYRSAPTRVAQPPIVAARRPTFPLPSYASFAAAATPSRYADDRRAANFYRLSSAHDESPCSSSSPSSSVESSPRLFRRQSSPHQPIRGDEEFSIRETVA